MYRRSRNSCHLHVTQADIDNWKREQRKALPTIPLRVSNAPLAHILTATTGIGAWEKLASIYAPKEAATIIQVRRKIYQAKCVEGEDIEEHIRILTEFRQQLAFYGQTMTEALVLHNLAKASPENSFHQHKPIPVVGS